MSASLSLMGQAVLGVGVFIGLPILFSENRRLIKKRLIAIGLSVQVALAIVLTQFALIQQFFHTLGRGIESIKDATLQGTSFVFGYVGGGATPFNVPNDLAAHTFVFAFQALPMIMVVSALSMLLFYWGVIPRVVQVLSKALQRTLHIGGSMGVVGAAKIFLGQIESSLLIRPYLKNFSRAEIFMVMCCGMATTSATVMALYGSILQGRVDNPIAHILIASIISVPGAITLARLLVPHEGEPTPGHLVTPYKFNNMMDAVAKGTADGLNIFLNIIAMLIVMAALVAMVNNLLGLIPLGGAPLTLQTILGLLMAPFAWLMGIPWEEALVAGKILGTKTALNEVFAFIELAGSPLSPRSALIMTYAVCGFANFSCIGITIAGLGAMAPERRDEIVSLGLRSMLIGTLTTCLSGTLMGMMAHFNPSLMGH
jgi:CNT family concentrative nucleoside transporter